MVSEPASRKANSFPETLSSSRRSAVIISYHQRRRGCQSTRRFQTYFFVTKSAKRNAGRSRGACFIQTRDCITDGMGLKRQIWRWVGPRPLTDAVALRKRVKNSNATEANPMRTSWLVDRNPVDSGHRIRRSVSSRRRNGGRRRSSLNNKSEHDYERLDAATVFNTKILKILRPPSISRGIPPLCQ